MPPLPINLGVLGLCVGWAAWLLSCLLWAQFARLVSCLGGSVPSCRSVSSTQRTDGCPGLTPLLQINLPDKQIRYT